MDTLQAFDLINSVGIALRKYSEASYLRTESEKIRLFLEAMHEQGFCIVVHDRGPEKSVEPLHEVA